MKDPHTALLQLAALRSGIDVSELPGGEGLKLEDGKDTNVYDPSEVLALGKEILTKHSSSLRSDLERFSLYEQLFIAALDVSDISLAKEYLGHITKRFPQSNAPGTPANTKSSSPHSSRVQRLLGMLAEAEDAPDKALKIYEAVLQDDEANMPIRKRMVAVYWSQGKRTQAIEALVEYLDHFMQDFEGWSQLSEMYLHESMYQQAAFCVEEMLLIKPANHIVMLRYADLVRTLGKEALALKYYCGALEVCEDNVRALYGIRLSTKSLLDKLKSSSGKKSEVAVLGEDGVPPSEETLKMLFTLAGTRLTEVYDSAAKQSSGAQKQGAAQINSVVKAWLKKQE